MSKNALVLIGHGSRLPYNFEAITTLAKIIEKNYDWDIVKYCFNEMNEPSIPNALQDVCTDKNVTKIVFAPVFIAAGAHIKEDIPKALGLPEGQTTDDRNINGVMRKIILSGPVGADEGLAAIIENKAKALLWNI